jgi:hypothetical protein
MNERINSRYLADNNVDSVVMLVIWDLDCIETDRMGQRRIRGIRGDTVGSGKKVSGLEDCQ